MMADIFSKPELFWFILGLILFLLELVLPGFFIFFFGLGAWVAAVVCLVGEPSTNLQIIIFAVTSVLSLIALRKVIQKRVFDNKDNMSEKIEDEFTGNDALAITGFGPGKEGKVEFKGTSWKSESDSEITKGQIVTIIQKENFKLKVKPKQ
jgi:membrane protein implicated in regulation of membrane protease activity